MNSYPASFHHNLPAVFLKSVIMIARITLIINRYPTTRQWKTTLSAAPARRGLNLYSHLPLIKTLLRPK
jgi:hypothetical protein